MRFSSSTVPAAAVELSGRGQALALAMMDNSDHVETTQGKLEYSCEVAWFAEGGPAQGSSTRGPASVYSRLTQSTGGMVGRTRTRKSRQDVLKKILDESTR